MGCTILANGVLVNYFMSQLNHYSTCMSVCMCSLQVGLVTAFGSGLPIGKEVFYLKLMYEIGYYNMT